MRSVLPRGVLPAKMWPVLVAAAITGLTACTRSGPAPPRGQGDAAKPTPRTGTANTTTPDGGDAAEESPTTIAAAAWTALRATPPDFAGAARLLGREDAARLREAAYTVPDHMEYVVQVESVRVQLALATGLRPVLEGFLAHVKEDVPARAKALVGLDHLLAGVMKSTPLPRMSFAAAATNQAQPGFANLQATRLRGWVLNELVSLGEPAAYHDPLTKREVINTMLRAKQPDPNMQVP